MKDIDFDLLIKTLGLIGAGVSWLYQSRSKIQREKIKLDLEILEKSKSLFGEADNRCRRIETRLTMAMSYLYGETAPTNRRSVPWADVAVAVLCFVGAWAFLATGFRTSGPWDYVIAAGLAFVGVGGVLNAINAARTRSTDA